MTVRDLDSGKSWQQPYDKLVIATGAHAIVPDIPGADAEGVYTLRTVEDGIRLKSTVHGGEHKAIAIVGGGFIGLEMAEELTNSGLEVHLFEVMPRLLPFLEERFSAAVLDVLQKHGDVCAPECRSSRAGNGGRPCLRRADEGRRADSR